MHRVAKKNPQVLTPAIYKDWIKSMDAFLFDCDGVLWRGTKNIEGAKETILSLRQMQKKVLFVTNNSTKSRQVYVQKLDNMGIPATEEDIISSASATADYLAQRLNPGTDKLYVIGECGLVDELQQVRFECLGKDDGEKNDLPQPVQVDERVKAVVIGLDRTLSYYKLAYGTACLRLNPGCLLIATNSDSSYPADGCLLPGAGACVSALETASGRPADVSIGKPSQELLSTVMTKYNLCPSRTCMIGDRLSTDIAFGVQGGLSTILVYSGVTTKEEINQLLASNEDGGMNASTFLPDFVVDSIQDLLVV